MTVFLTLLTAFASLSTDLYLPALPTISQIFGVSNSLTSLSLISFFLSFSIFTLVWGPISDKYGRKIVLIIGTATYMTSGFLIVFSQDIYYLIVMRILQGLGAAAVSAMSYAILKDIFKDRKREKVLAVITSMVIICPTAAPLLGAILLRFISWKGIFLIQALFGLIVFLFSLLYKETIPEKLDAPLPKMMGRLIVVLKNPAFTVLLVIFSIFGASSLAFIGSSSYIYQEFFGQSSTAYSLFFGVTIVFMAIGPFTYLILSKYFSKQMIITVCLVVTVISGLLLIFISDIGPFAFSALIIPSFVAVSCSKPPAVNLMLDKQKGDSGSASSLINSAGIGAGAIAIASASIPLMNQVKMLGLIFTVIAVVSLAIWVFQGRKYV